MSLFIESEDGLRLEARWDRPPHIDMVAVVCHPHPQQGGTMTAPLLMKVVDHLVGHGIAVLRFNFRGVGASAGEWSGGFGEVHDVAGAMAVASSEHPEMEISLVGWSFGAATALRWQAAASDTSTYVGIAPPVSSDSTPTLPPPDELMPAARSFIIGDRDQFTTVDQLEQYAAGIDATITVLNGSDHFFYFREERVGEAIIDHLADGA